MPDDRPIMRLPSPNQAQTIAELERELRMRATVYPAMVANRRLKLHELEHRNACLRKAIADLREFYEGAGNGR